MQVDGALADIGVARRDVVDGGPPVAVAEQQLGGSGRVPERRRWFAGVAAGREAEPARRCGRRQHQPDTRHAPSTQPETAAPAPSKKATERSSVPPAPGGRSWPTAPQGCGSSSGAEVSPESGLPSRNTASAASTTPPAPRRVPSPATAAAMASATSPTTAALAR